MKIVYDENIPYAAAFFAELGQLHPVSGRQITPAQVKGADLLLVRSVTPVNADLLADSQVRFVGSCTIGTDHLDLDEMNRRGIHWRSAPGCNAEAVVNYVFSVLMQFAEGDLTALAQRTIGVVGAGNVGGRLCSQLEMLGLRVMVCDPPRAEQENGVFYPLDEVIEKADLICCHTPLTRMGKHPSYHLFDAERLARLRTGCWLINAGRGAVIDNRALLRVLPERPDLKVALDVWEPEPGIDPALVDRVDIATPHIAGYSLEGRARGTERVYQALCAYLDRPATVKLEQLLPSAATLAPVASAGNRIGALMQQAYSISNDDRRLRQMVAAGELPAGFDRLRREYPLRRDFSAYSLCAADFTAKERTLLRGLGFRCEERVG